MKQAVVLLLVFVATVESLKCRTCDSFVSCSSEMIESCPPYTKCYAITKNGQVTQKGCAPSCSSIPQAAYESQCTECDDFDNCNGIGHGVHEHSHRNIGQGVQTSFGIGSGVSGSNGGIGHGVVGNSGIGYGVGTEEQIHVGGNIRP